MPPESFMRKTLFEAREIDQFQYLRDDLALLGPRHSDNFERQRCIFFHCPPWQQHGILENQSDMTIEAGCIGRLAVDEDVAGDGCSIPDMRLRMVDLPQPLGPMMQMNSLWRTLSETS